VFKIPKNFEAARETPNYSPEVDLVSKLLIEVKIRYSFMF